MDISESINKPERFIGFSSGCLYQTHKALSPDTINVFRQSGCSAIELMFHGVEDIDDFAALTASDVEGFDFVSVHAPIYRGPHQIEAYGESLRMISNKLGELSVQSVVVHPDMFENFQILKRYDLPYAIENMDDRKKSCRNVDDLKKVFGKIGASFVLDVNHVYTNDKTFVLEQDLLNAFGDKLSEIHLSGFDTFHDPLYKTKQDYFADRIKKLDAPVIIESGVQSPDEIGLELEYVRNLLK